MSNLRRAFVLKTFMVYLKVCSPHFRHGLAYECHECCNLLPYEFLKRLWNGNKFLWRYSRGTLEIRILNRTWFWIMQRNKKTGLWFLSKIPDFKQTDWDRFPMKWFIWIPNFSQRVSFRRCHIQVSHRSFVKNRWKLC